MRRIAIAGVLTGCLLQVGCSERQPAAASFDTTVSMKQLMNWVIEPNAEAVFASVATIVTEQGEEQIQPRTDEAWNTVRNHAAMVLESGNLLMIEGRSGGPAAGNPQDWMEKAQAMSAAARAAIEATEVKDPESLFVASGDIYQACTDCHAKYLFTQPMPAGE